MDRSEVIPEVIARTASEALPLRVRVQPRTAIPKCFPVRCHSFVCQTDKLVERRICSGVISVPDVVITCLVQRIHQCGSVAGFARFLDRELAVAARSRGIAK